MIFMSSESTDSTRAKRVRSAKIRALMVGALLVLVGFGLAFSRNRQIAEDENVEG
jgi:hypothetical protein